MYESGEEYTTRKSGKGGSDDVAAICILPSDLLHSCSSLSILFLVYHDHRIGPPRPLILVVAFIFID